MSGGGHTPQSQKFTCVNNEIARDRPAVRVPTFAEVIPQVHATFAAAWIRNSPARAAGVSISGGAFLLACLQYFSSYSSANYTRVGVTAHGFVPVIGSSDIERTQTSSLRASFAVGGPEAACGPQELPRASNR